MNSTKPSGRCTKPGKSFSRSARFLRALLDSEREGVLVVSPEGKIVFANRMAEELWRYDSAKLTGMQVSQLFYRQIALIDLGSNPPHVPKPIRVEAVQGDGGLIGLEVQLRHLPFEDQDYRVLTVQPLALRIEEEVVQEEIRVFESLEVFASGLAHEINNILTGIMGNLHLALEHVGRNAGRLEPTLLEGAYSASLRAREVTRELFQMARGDQPVQGANALPQLICEASLMSLAGSRVQMEYEFAPDLRAAFIDAAQVGQVAHQLLRFAAERMGHSGRLRVKARNFRVDPGDSGFGGELIPGDYVMCSITIPDCSLVATDCARLFEPYRVPGIALTGLSLAICRSRVRRQGGLLRAESEEGGDLRLEIYLPACREVANRAVTLLRVDVPRQEGCRVLVMDDEELVRVVLKRSLEGLGHRVEAVADGESAVAAYLEAKEQGDRFDVVFLDLRVRSGTGGKEACRELLELDPLATCVLISGSVGDEAMIDPLGHGFVENLEKPFDLHEIGKVMNRVLERMGRGDSSADPVFEDPVALDAEMEPSNIVPVDFRLQTDRC